jgi:hypothetical protein
MERIMGLEMRASPQGKLHRGQIPSLLKTEGGSYSRSGDKKRGYSFFGSLDEEDGS